ncbi:MAG: hypothetical protein BGO69_01465 [Bacteroidetes bacterium 46-16]|nr:MAG: hypothetical protein BGO69_01465 [Bacteroidetes bacterium 46-16]
MQTITVEINDAVALKTLQSLAQKHFIRIVEQTDIDSPALPGTPLSVAQFKAWIENAEHSPTISLKEARSRWQSKKKQLTK